MLAEDAWPEVATEIERLTEKLAGPAADVRRALRGVYLPAGAYVGVHAQADGDALGLHPRGTTTDTALVRCKQAVAETAEVRPWLSREDVSSGAWVKIAEVPVLRQVGEALNFLPGHYPGGMPNHAGPLASALTSGMLGAGLGYGAGWAAEKLFPTEWERERARRVGLLLGAAMGAAPGLGWAAHNVARGRSPNDASVVSDTRVVVPELSKEADGWERAADLAAKSAFETFGAPEHLDAVRVDIDSLGRTLWSAEADPRTAATAMNATWAASRMPDPQPVPGAASPHQFGLLGTMLGAAGGGLSGYVAGRLVGRTLGVLTGMPEATQNRLAESGAVLGIVRATLPRLFR